MKKRKTPEGVGKNRSFDSLAVMQIATAILAVIAAVTGIIGLFR